MKYNSLKLLGILSIFVTIILSFLLITHSFFATFGFFVDAVNEIKEVNEHKLPLIKETEENRLPNFLNEALCIDPYLSVYSEQGNIRSISELFNDSMTLCVFIPNSFEEKEDFIKYLLNQEKYEPVIFIEHDEQKTKAVEIDNSVYYIKKNPFILSKAKPVFFLLNNKLKTNKVFVAYTFNYNFNSLYLGLVQ